MSNESILDGLGDLGVVPVVEVPSVEAGLGLAAALADGGLPIVEVTLRTSAAADVIRAIAAERPDVLVGAGTIIDRAGLDAAVSAGARFGVSPGFDRELSEAAREAGLPYLPGAVTATEVQAALAAGHRTLKFFPAEASGGLPVLKALAGPFSSAGLRFVPTGGIGEANAAAYLATPQVLAVGGTWIAPRADIEAGAWEAIAGRARAVQALLGSAAGA